MEGSHTSKPAIRFWYLLLFGLFLFLFVAELLEASMFIDGVWYAVISNNLANGVGTLWQPQFSKTIFPAFHEHPPFIFGIQSLFFRIFGDHFLTERLFSLFMYSTLATLIVGLWQKAVPQQSVYKYMLFLPLIFWQANIVSYFFLPANLLDTPLAILAALSIYILWSSTEKKQAQIQLISAGIILGFSVLTKGFTGLFPLAFIPLHYLIFKPYSWQTAIKRTLILGCALIAFLGILFILIPSSLESFNKYLDIQLIASLNGERRLYYYQTNRFFIIGQLLWTLVPMLFILFVCTVLQKALRLKIKTTQVNTLNRSALLFLLIGLSASLPIMISPRQALPYLIPSIPFFSLAFSIWVAPKIHVLLVYINKLRFPIIKTMEFGALFLCVLGIFLINNKYGHSNDRDFSVIEDAKTIGSLTGPNTIIASTTYNMYISGYLMRYHNISIDTLSQQAHTYLITKKGQPYSLSEYEKVNIKTHDYLLYKRKEISSTKD